MFGFGGTRGFQLGVVLEAKNLLKGEMRRVKGDTDEAKRKLAGLQGQLRQLERYGRMMKIGAGITAIGAGASVAAVKLIDANKQIEESLAGVGTVATGTYAEWLAMEDKARERVEELAVAHRGSFEDISEGMYQMLSSGIAYDTVADGMDHVIEGNIAMRGELSETSKLFGTVINNFGDQLDQFETDGEKMEHVADIFAYATKKYMMTGPAIAESMSYAAPTMKEWNMEVEEGVAVLGALHNAGIEGGRAGTAFAATMRQMLEVEDKLGITIKRNADGTYDFAGTMEELRKKYGENIAGNTELQKKLQETFGDEGKRAIVALWTMGDAIDANTEAMKKNKGMAHDMAQAYERTSGAKLEKLAKSWNFFTASLMDDSASVDWAVKSLTELVAALDGMPDWAKDLVAGGMAVGGVAGSVAGPLMTGYGALMQYKMAKGIGAAGATRVFETNPAAMEGGGVATGAAGTAAKSGFLGKAGLFGLATGLMAGKVAVDDFILKKAQKGLFGKEYVAGFGERTKMFGKAAWETGKAWNPLAGSWGVSEESRKAWRDVYLTETFRTEQVREEKAKEVSKTENLTININNVNTQAKDGAALASELKKQARRTGKRKSP
ncbi:MAG: phage tail tape measure protein [Candidatus Zixiibacteriota bacterium]|jgi:TP901 family phage tail tape measure protein